MTNQHGQKEPAPSNEGAQGVTRPSLDRLSIRERKQLVLDTIETELTLASAARRLGIYPAAVYDWARHDPHFAEDLETARRAALEHGERTLYRRGVDGAERRHYDVGDDGTRKLAKVVVEPDTPALLAVLRARVPAYRASAQPVQAVIVRSYGATIDVQGLLRAPTIEDASAPALPEPNQE